MATRDDNIIAEEARAIEVGEETAVGAPNPSGGSGRGRRDTWATHTGFILACVGSAVGMANIWLFPYRVAQLGGAAFLIPYLIFVALLGFTGVIGEMAFGRAMGTGPMGAFGRAMEMRGVRHGERIGKIIGLIPTLGSLALAIGYAVVLGWACHYLFSAMTGELMAQTDTGAFFGAMASDFGNVGFHLLGLAITFGIMILGVSRGIEKANKVLMPTFFVLFVIIAIRVATLPGAEAGYLYLLVPRWEALLNPTTWVYALGQAFFSLSLAGCGTLVYGSYLKRDVDVVDAAKNVAIFDTIAGLVSACVVVPAVFAFGLDVSSGPPLLFITLAQVFQEMPFGGVFAVILFVAVVFAAIGITVACLLIMGTFTLVAVNADANLKQAEQDNEILAFVDDSYTEAQAKALQKKLEAVDNVASVTFISREEAMQSFISEHPDEEYFQDLDPNILRDRFAIKVKELKLQSQTVELIKAIPGIGGINAYAELTNGFITVRNIATVICLTLIAVLFVVSMFIISNTIKLTTFDRRDEIAIMKMVGATNGFIRWPFVYEGFMLGLTGAILAFLLQWGLYEAIAQGVADNDTLQLLSIVPFQQLWKPVGGVFLGAGILVGVGGSLSAIRRFLQV
mgnify:CR=1 FL=1